MTIRIRSLFPSHLLPLGLTAGLTAALSLGCAVGVGGPDDPVPQANYCSDFAAVEACKADASKAGSYPAVDALAAALLGPAPDTLTADGALGCSYALSIDGELLYAGAVGVTDDGKDDPSCLGGTCPWGLDDLSPVASVSKTLTGLAIMRLVENGQLPEDLTTVTVADLLPDAPPALAGFTVHDLLGHISGLDTASYDAAYMSPDTVAALVPELDEPGLHPRAMWYAMKDTTTASVSYGTPMYSSAAYRILGAIVDAHTLLTPADFLDEKYGEWIPGTESMSQAELTSAQLGGYEWFVQRMLKDANLPPGSRHFASCQASDPRRAELDLYVSGFTWNSATAQFQTANNLNADHRNGAHGPAGGWLMTVGDVARLANGVVGRHYVSEASLQRMKTFVSNTGAWNWGYGVSILPMSFSADPTATVHDGYGHGGDYTSLGHHAMWRAVELPGGRSLTGAMICLGGDRAGVNAFRPAFSSGNLNIALGRMLDVVYTDFVAAPATARSPIRYDADRANCGPNSPSLLGPFTAEFGAELAEIWSAIFLVSGKDARSAESLARRRVSAEPEGRDLLAAWDAGDLERVVSLGFDMMTRRRSERLATSTSEPTTSEPTSGATTTSEPTSGATTTSEPTSGATATSEPTSSPRR